MLVLGEVGHNFAAGMTGGVAYVYDEYGTLPDRINDAGIALRAPADAELDRIRTLLEEHVAATQSPRGIKLLYRFEAVKALFVKAVPIEYERVMQQSAGASYQKEV